MSSFSLDCQNPPTAANQEPTKPQLKSTLTRTDRERKIGRESHRNRGSRMSKFRDPAIKLFGKTIPLPTKEQFVSVLDVSAATIQSTSASALLHKPNRDDKNPSGGDLTKVQQQNGTSNQVSEDLKDSKTPSSIDKETTTSSSPNEEQNDMSESQEKTLKKPDKIIPCPRCNSMDTKFCYYNNYNVNQPRHFCKNCQRYWTAGGTMRNVPIGAGRRKNKHSSAASLHYRHILVPDSLQSAQSNILNFGNSGNHPPSPPPLCESMASVLNLAAAEKTPQNGFNNRQEMMKGEDHSSSIEKGCSYVGSIQEQQMMMMMMNYGFPGPPWPFHWPNSSQWNNHNTAMPLPSFCPPPGFPLSFLPPPNTPTFWGCSLPAAAATWNMPWLPQPQPPTTNPNCPILGKHSREGNMIQEENKVPGRSSEVWIPKTLRIDDPSEAARSSIWETLGIKNDKTSSINEGGLFKSFQSNGEEKKNAHIADTFSMLQANPAALSRSQNFHENS